MKIPQLETCFGFISLRTGSKLFGFLSLVGCISLSLVNVMEMIYLKSQAPEHFEEMAIILSVDILAQFIEMAASVYMLLGVYQEKANKIPAWLISTAVVTVLKIFCLPPTIERIYATAVFITGYYYFELHWVVVGLFVLIDDIYGWLVVYSYYRTMVPQIENII